MRQRDGGAPRSVSSAVYAYIGESYDCAGGSYGGSELEAVEMGMRTGRRPMEHGREHLRDSER